MNTHTVSAHDDTWLLLPWLANGRLAGAQRAQVEEHVRACAACAQELRAQRQLCALLTEPERVTYAPGPSLRKLLDRIDGHAPPPGRARAPAVHGPAPRGHLAAAWRPPGLAWAATFLLTAALGVLTGTAYHWSQPAYATYTTGASGRRRPARGVRPLAAVRRGRGTAALGRRAGRGGPGNAPASSGSCRPATRHRAAPAARRARRCAHWPHGCTAMHGCAGSSRCLPPRPPLTTRRDRPPGITDVRIAWVAVLASLSVAAHRAPAAPAPLPLSAGGPRIVVAFANAPQGTPAPAGTTGTRYGGDGYRLAQGAQRQAQRIGSDLRAARAHQLAHRGPRDALRRVRGPRRAATSRSSSRGCRRMRAYCSPSRCRSSAPSARPTPPPTTIRCTTCNPTSPRSRWPRRSSTRRARASRWR